MIADFTVKFIVKSEIIELECHARLRLGLNSYHCHYDRFNFY